MKGIGLSAFVCGRGGMVAAFREQRARVVWVVVLNVNFDTEDTACTEAEAAWRCGWRPCRGRAFFGANMRNYSRYSYHLSIAIYVS
jgi:hypothetical protein